MSLHPLGWGTWWLVPGRLTEPGHAQAGWDAPALPMHLVSTGDSDVGTWAGLVFPALGPCWDSLNKGSCVAAWWPLCQGQGTMQQWPGWDGNMTVSNMTVGQAV